MCSLQEHIEREKRARQQAILVREDGTTMGPYPVVAVEPTPTDDPDTEAVTVTLASRSKP